MPFAFEKLEAYQRAVAFSDEIASLTESFPNTHGFLVDQLNRVALSIEVRIADGSGRRAKDERRSHLSAAHGHVHACVPLLEVARWRGLVSDARQLALRRELDSIARMISSLLSAANRRSL